MLSISGSLNSHHLGSSHLIIVFAMETIALDRIEVRNKVVEYHYSVSQKLKRFFKTDRMFIEYDEAMDGVPMSILSIPFVSCMAGLMWITDCTVFVDEIDKTFYESLFRVKRAYQELHYDFQLKGLLVPSIITTNGLKESSDGLLLFGGGVDCHSSFLRNRDKISHLCNIYGWLNDLNQENKTDESDKKQTADYAQRMEVHALHVRSNFASQFNLREIDVNYNSGIHSAYWYGFLHSMAFISIAMPLCFKKGISNIIIASSFTKGRASVRCASYITTDSQFAFASSGVVLHDGFELSRQDKVRLIVDWQKESGQPYAMQVCSFNDHNCCECEKCFRTMIAIVAENGDPRQFGFEYNGPLKQHWENVINRDVSQWGIQKESYYFGLTRQRMLENYDNIQDKEFADWFLNYDFEKAKKQGLLNYYRKNFFSILKRKIHS